MGKPTFLEKSFAFYASYHNNPVNQLIHVICIWPIFWTAVLMVNYCSPVEAFADYSFFGYPVSISLILCAFYFLFYFFVELPDGFGGLIAAGLVVVSFVSSNHVKETVPDAFKIGAVVHIFAWLAQFYGHGVHEKRSPALLDNLFGAVVMAPLFVVIEVLFLLGYRPNFRKSVEKVVEQNIKSFQESKKK